MDGEIWTAVMVAVISALLTGSAGLTGIVLTIRSGNKQRLQEAKRATHDAAVDACESSRKWIMHTVHTVDEMRLEQSNHEGGSQYSLPKPMEFFAMSNSESLQVRSALYRVAMGNADKQTRRLANLLHFEMEQIEDQFETAMQLADHDDLLAGLAENIRRLQKPLDELEQSVVKAIAVKE